MSEPLYSSIEVHETVDGIDVNASRRTAGAASRASSSAADSSTRAEAEAEDSPVRKPRKRMAGIRPSDKYIWGIYLTLLVISVIELFSASSTEVSGANVYFPLIRHGRFLLAGLVIVLLLQRIPYVIISKFSWVFAVLTLGLLVLSSVIGVEINGAQRAISVGGFTIQPAEISKLAVVCLLAYILGRNQRPGGVNNRGVITAAIVVVVFCACMIRNGMTNMILLMGVSLAMMLIGGIQWRKMGYVFMAYAAGIGIMYMASHIGRSSNPEFEQVKKEQSMLASAQGVPVTQITPLENAKKKIDRTDTRKNRITNFIRGVHPDDTITDDNRQVMMARFAQANGGLVGQGPGNSRESARLPLAFSDYIYSIIIEDTGFVGGALVLVLFLLLLARAGRIAYRCTRALPAFLILGCALMIVLQALVHMGIVTGIMPVSGQPLPFISKGGTSVLVMSTAIGIMLSVSRFASYNTDGKAIKAELNALPEDMQAENFSASDSR